MYQDVRTSTIIRKVNLRSYIKYCVGEIDIDPLGGVRDGFKEITDYAISLAARCAGVGKQILVAITEHDAAPQGQL